jgi:hypothetical protein
MDGAWKSAPLRRDEVLIRQLTTPHFRRIVQTPGGIAIFYDVGQGQGWQRNIVMNGSPHLPDSIRQWYGDSRGDAHSPWHRHEGRRRLTRWTHACRPNGSRSVAASARKKQCAVVTSTSSRNVIIQAAPSILPTDDASTTSATSSTQ